MNYLTPAQVKEYKNQINQDPTQAANVIYVAFSQGEILMDYDSTSFLEDGIRQAGQNGASLVLQNLNKIKISQNQNTGYFSGKIIGMILDYFPKDLNVVKQVLDWDPDLIGETALLKNISIKSSQDTAYFRKLIASSIQSTSVKNFKVAEFVLHLIMQSPGFEEEVLDTLSEVQTEINLVTVVQYLIENPRTQDALFNKLDVIAMVDTGSYNVAEFLMKGFGQRRVQAFFKYVRHSTRILFLEKEIEFLASQINQNEYLAFLSEIDNLWQNKFYPSKVVLSLILNPNLPKNLVINSKVSLRLYKSMVDQIRYFIDAFRSNNQKITFIELLQFLTADPVFSSLDKDFHREIIYSTRNLQPSETLNTLKLRLLFLIDFAQDSFDDDFITSILNTYITPNTANFLLTKIAKLGRYPFYKVDFMVYLLEATDEDFFKKYIMNAILLLFPREYDLEKLFLRLSQDNPHNFAFIYIKKKRKLGRKFSRHSKEALKIQVNCWRHLSFGQRLKCLWPF
jgi:hypothetical protein